MQSTEFLDAVEAVGSAALGQSMPARRTVAIPGGRRVSTGTVAEGFGNGGFGCCCLLLVAMLFLRGILRGAFRPRFYGFGHRQVYRPNMPWWAWLLFGNAMGSAHRHRHHSSSGWSSGSSWGGGGGGSFGGGSFGGGGASGSW